MTPFVEKWQSFYITKEIEECMQLQISAYFIIIGCCCHSFRCITERLHLRKYIHAYRVIDRLCKTSIGHESLAFVMRNLLFRVWCPSFAHAMEICPCNAMLSEG